MRKPGNQETTPDAFSWLPGFLIHSSGRPVLNAGFHGFWVPPGGHGDCYENTAAGRYPPKQEVPFRRVSLIRNNYEEARKPGNDSGCLFMASWLPYSFFREAGPQRRFSWFLGAPRGAWGLVPEAEALDVGESGEEGGGGGAAQEVDGGAALPVGGEGSAAGAGDG